MRIITGPRALFLAGAIVLLVLHIAGLLQGIESLTARALRPLQTTLATFLPWPTRTAAGPVTASHVRDLEDTVARLLIENARLHEAVAQKNSVTGEQNFLAQQKLHGKDATIIGQSTEADDPIVILNHGSEIGIEKGQPVITGDGVLVGIIESAEQNRSTVLLMTSTQTQVGAVINNATHSQGIVSGEHGLTFLMKFIPQGEKVDKGQTVVTSAVDEHIPANLLIGQITDVRFQPGDLFQEATIRPLVDVHHVRYVAVITRQ